MDDHKHRDTLRYVIGVAFATFVFGCGFYGLVLYEFELDDLTKGALISLSTLAAQFVFGEALASAVGRRAQQSFDAGKKQSNGGSTTTIEQVDDITVNTKGEQ